MGEQIYEDGIDIFSYENRDYRLWKYRWNGGKTLSQCWS
jgi:hypothetical protein